MSDGLVSNISRIITSLLKCSATIRNPHPHDRFSLSAAETDTTYFHVMDIAHVQQKFPRASNAICERLGKANSYRRQYFKYREARHIRLERGTSLVNDGQSTVASSIPQALKDGDGLNNESGFIDEDYQSESGQKMTTIAIEAGRLPPLPAMSERGPFECPYCYTVIAVTTRKAWEYGMERHILRDPRCYICLHDHCPQVTQQFEGRHEWIQHMREKHWRVWQCPAGCDASYTSRSSFVAHMLEFHGRTSIAGSTTYRTRTTWITEPCPLCEEPIRSANNYQSHVGRHHVDLALFTLPNADYDELLSGGSEESTSSSISESVVDVSDLKLALQNELETHIRAEADESAQKKWEESKSNIRQESEEAARKEAEDAFQQKMFEMAQEERARAEERAIALERARKEIGDARAESYEAARRELDEEARIEAEGMPPKTETKLPDWGESEWQEPTETMTPEEKERSKVEHQALQRARKELQEAGEKAEQAAREAAREAIIAEWKAEEERVELLAKMEAKDMAQAEQILRKFQEAKEEAEQATRGGYHCRKEGDGRTTRKRNSRGHGSGGAGTSKEERAKLIAEANLKAELEFRRNGQVEVEIGGEETGAAAQAKFQRKQDLKLLSSLR
ncbi:hypothetical protein PG988_010536 [Apiospora saccharicola]